MVGIPGIASRYYLVLPLWKKPMTRLKTWLSSLFGITWMRWKVSTDGTLHDPVKS